MIDPRPSVIRRRLEGVGRILVFSSGKGGVGKSLCSSVSALLLANRGLRAGLLDLDFHGASTHIFLGASLGFPEEEHGILPLTVGGPPVLTEPLRYMSIAAFTGEKAVPLRGEDVSNALIELLAVTVWGELDVLVVDMPPGIGDEVFDLVRFMPRSELVVISTASVVSVQVVRRLIHILQELDIPVLGVLENMVRSEPDPGGSVGAAGRAAGRWADVPLLGSVPLLPEVEAAVGSPGRLLDSPFASALEGALDGVLSV